MFPESLLLVIGRTLGLKLIGFEVIRAEQSSAKTNVDGTTCQKHTKILFPVVPAEYETISNGINFEKNSMCCFIFSG